MSILSHVVVANQALYEDTKVRGPGVEARSGHGLTGLTSRHGPVIVLHHMKVLLYLHVCTCLLLATFGTARIFAANVLCCLLHDSDQLALQTVMSVDSCGYHSRQPHPLALVPVDGIPGQNRSSFHGD